MKKELELDVDYVGGQEPLTKEEEIALSAFIKSKRVTTVRKDVSRLLKRKKELVLI